MNNYQRIICFFLLFVGYMLIPSPSVAQQDYSVLAGEWLRTDGGYLVKVSNVQTEGQATVEYFNPQPIHVEQSAITTQKGLMKLFIKLRDKGYEGSTYTLYYYAEKDALAGFYYHATMDRTFKVIFMRKNV